MSKFSKNFFITIPLLIVVVIGYRYYQYIIQKNFILEVNTICNPQIENCFDAIDDLSFGQNPYEKVSVLAKYAPKCLEEHNCEGFSCQAGLDTNFCLITYCSDETKVDGEECTNQNNQ